MTLLDYRQVKASAWETHLVQLQNAMLWDCAYCERQVSENKGFVATTTESGFRRLNGVLVCCPNCNCPTFFAKENEAYDIWGQYPVKAYGNDVDHLPTDIANLYGEARRCFSVSAFSACVMLCRKLLMHIAVEQGATEKNSAGHSNSFKYFVKYLDDENIIPKNAKGWTDHIRDKGNEANHEIKDVSQEDAEMLLQFVELILRNVYEAQGKLDAHKSSGVPPTVTP